MGINFCELKSTIFRENKLLRILQNRIFCSIKVSSALLSSLKVQSWTKVNGTTTKNGIVLVAQAIENSFKRPYGEVEDNIIINI